MLDKYFWYKEIPNNVDYLSFTDENELLERLKYKALDRFSFITDESKYISQIKQGQYLGYGFSLAATPDYRVFVRYIHKSSPAFEAKIERGDEILEINLISIKNHILGNSLNKALNATDPTQNLNLKIKKKNGFIQQIELNPNIVTINPVLASKIFSSILGNVGYLAFNSFITPAIPVLDAEFKKYKQANVKKLILDLRYNQGGLVDVAQRLSSYLFAENKGQRFTYLYHNDKNSTNNSSYQFETVNNALTLDEIIVLTSNETCSASEMLINSLRPFKNITAIGSTTCGKPVGMYGHKFCGKRLLMIEFAGQNALKEGIFFNGLSPVCEAYDNIHYALGDTNESLLAAGIDYLNSRSCVWSNKSLEESDSYPEILFKDY